MARKVIIIDSMKKYWKLSDEIREQVMQKAYKIAHENPRMVALEAYYQAVYQSMQAEEIPLLQLK